MCSFIWLLVRPGRKLFGASLIGGALGVAWLHVVEICPPLFNKAGCSIPQGNTLYFFAFFKWFFITALAYRFALATGLLGARTLVAGLRIEPKGIYDDGDRRLSMAQIAKAIASFEKEECDALLQALGDTQGQADEPLEALRARCEQAAAALTERRA